MSFLKKPKKHVLVVDDEKLVIEMTREFLEESGFKATGVGSTEAAMEVMEREHVDAILLDIRLPNEDGLTFLQKIKAIHPQIHVVMLTGSGYEENLMQTALRYGASGYVSKDTDLENVITALKNALKA